MLIVDADPQANAGSGVGITIDELQYSLYDCMINDVEPSSHYTYRDTESAHITIYSDLVGAEIELVYKENREYVLSNMLEKVTDLYDYIFIDCLPSLGLITVNVLTAAHAVLIPIQCEIFALEGLSRLKTTIAMVKEELNPELTIEGIVLSMFDQRLRLG